MFKQFGICILLYFKTHWNRLPWLHWSWYVVSQSTVYNIKWWQHFLVYRYLNNLRKQNVAYSNCPCMTVVFVFQITNCICLSGGYRFHTNSIAIQIYCPLKCICTDLSTFKLLYSKLFAQYYIKVITSILSIDGHLTDGQLSYGLA